MSFWRTGNFQNPDENFNNKIFSFQTNGLIKAHEILSNNFRSGIKISRSKKSAEKRLQDINSCINNLRL